VVTSLRRKNLHLDRVRRAQFQLHYCIGIFKLFFFCNDPEENNQSNQEPKQNSDSGREISKKNKNNIKFAMQYFNSIEVNSKVKRNNYNGRKYISVLHLLAFFESIKIQS
jgi:hypothetical protein